MNAVLSIFSGNVGVNGYGVAGLVVMLIGACTVFASSKIASSFGWKAEKGVWVKFAGVLVCAAGAILVIAIGK